MLHDSFTSIMLSGLQMQWSEFVRSLTMRFIFTSRECLTGLILMNGQQTRRNLVYCVGCITCYKI